MVLAFFVEFPVSSDVQHHLGRNHFTKYQNTCFAESRGHYIEEEGLAVGLWVRFLKLRYGPIQCIAQSIGSAECLLRLKPTVDDKIVQRRSVARWPGWILYGAI